MSVTINIANGGGGFARRLSGHRSGPGGRIHPKLVKVRAKGALFSVMLDELLRV